MLELFLNRGCNIEAVNHNAYTALHKAAATGSIPAVRALIKRGANIRFVFQKLLADALVGRLLVKDKLHCIWQLRNQEMKS